MAAEQIDDDGRVSPKRRFDQRDWSYVADYIIDEYQARKNRRRDLEAQWAEIDRQIAMVPDLSYKSVPGAEGRVDASKVWMAEMELPLQAQALEVLTADARRLMFAEGGSSFRGHAETTDDYLDKASENVRIVGDKIDVPSDIVQDNADKLVEGFLAHTFSQYDLPSRMDRVNAESFRYGVGVARARMETKSIFIHEARGVRRERHTIPVLHPASIKQTYLDEPMPSMHSAEVHGEAHITEDWIKLENLQVAANRGSSDPDDADGGWMAKNVANLKADKDGYVRLLEMEGDIVVPRKTVRSVIIPGAIVTVAVGVKDAGSVTRNVVRFRYRKWPFSSFCLFPYHYEDATTAYPTSPLMKGRTVQVMAVQALNRLLDSAALKNAPPVGYDKSNVEFAQSGGPLIFPGAQWATIDEVKVYEQIGGDPNALAGMMTLAINLFAELTGVLPARLGAQTISHTTAFAKDAEIQRGAVRTVDYVNQASAGPLPRWLDMAYRMGRKALGDKRISVHIPAYGGFVEFSAAGLPENVMWEWFGAGGPSEKREKQMAMLQSLQLALQMDQLGASMGAPPNVKISAAQRAVLREGGWTDVDTILANAEDAAAGNQAAPGVQGTGQGGPGTAIAALQAIQGGVR